MLIDTHSHLFLNDFDEDRALAVQRAIDAGVTSILLPNIDHTTLEPLMKMCQSYPRLCYPMIGVHPSSVANDYETELAFVRAALETPHPFIGIGEIGMDLYWDKTYRNEQEKAFVEQIELAIAHGLPVVIHCRDAFDEIYNVLSHYLHTDLKGIFHSFSGTIEEAVKLSQFPALMLGINGIVTFKNSSLKNILPQIPISRIVLETDCPYLTPVPYRGRRNETSYITYTLAKVAEVYQLSVDDVSAITSVNARKIFSAIN